MTITPILSEQQLATSTLEIDNTEIKYQWVFNLNPANICEYNDLTFPSIQKRWQTFKQRGKLLGVAAFSAETMVGLVITECIANTTSAEIISLFVDPDYRHQGIGTNLVQCLEKGLVKLGCNSVEVKYKTTKITNKAFEPLLKNCNWAKPETKTILGMGTTETFAKAPWLRKYKLSPDFTIFPWQELTDEDRQQIQTRQAEKPWYPEILSPFHPDPRLETLNSLGLSYRGKILGWIINHRVAADTIRYSVLFVAPEIQGSGKGMVLLAESIRLQLNSSITYAKSAVQIHNKPMLRIVRRHLSPYLIGQAESRLAKKNLVSTTQK